MLLPVGHFGLGHGSGTHAPDEYYVIESKDPEVRGIDGAVRSLPVRACLITTDLRVPSRAAQAVL